MTSPSAEQKGKGRESDSADRTAFYDDTLEIEDETNTTADYETALESALYEPRSSSTHRYSQSANGDSRNLSDEDGEFVYTGEDDDDMKVFREDAKFESLDYKERLRGVLGDGADADEPIDNEEVGEPPTPQPPSFGRTDGPSMSTPPRSPHGSTSLLSRSPSTVRRRNSLEQHVHLPSPSPPTFQTPLPPSQPFPRPKVRPPSIHSPASSTHSSMFPQDSSRLLESPQSSRFGSLPARRPPMNPLVSRLRSTSATPSHSFRGVRSASQASSLASLAVQDAEELHGFADDSFAFHANDSFTSKKGRNGHGINSLSGSRRSSTSNMRDAIRAGAEMSPSLSSNAFRDADTSSTTLFPPARRKAPAVHPPEVLALVPPLKWTVLKRLSQRLFSHPSNNGKGSATIADPGTPTCLAVSGGLIIVGTSKGWCMIYDYSQSLKAIAGNEDIAKQCGAVTAVALSQDSTFIAVAYQSAHIHLYEWGKKPGVPVRTVNPTSLQAINAGKAEGHLARDAAGRGSIIRHLGFVGRRHTAIVSGDQYGLAFYHSLGKVLGLANTDILRILGKYPSQLPLNPQGAGNGEGDADSFQPRLLGVQSLPLGTAENFTDEYNLVALLTAGKLVVAGLKPSPRTWWRYMKQFASKDTTEVTSRASSSRSSEVGMPHLGNGEKAPQPEHGCLAWLPSIDRAPPLLAWSWGGSLRIVKVEGGRAETTSTNHAGRPNALRRPTVQPSQRNGTADTTSIPLFRPIKRATTSNGEIVLQPNDAVDILYQSEETVSALQWLNRHMLVLLTSSRVLLYNVEEQALVEKTAYFGADFATPADRPLDSSLKAYKGKLFYMTARDLRAGRVLSWADRVLHLVSTGRLIQAIDLLVVYYTADKDQSSTPLPFSTLDLPIDQTERKMAVEPRLREILAASADYAFSENRMKDEAAIDRYGTARGIDRTEFFENLVDASIRASLAMDSFDFLFDDLAERYAENGIEGIFLERLEPFILSNDIKVIPVAISQQLIARHAERDELREAEDLIWHIEPQCLDVNQTVSLCSKHRLYEALVYVYTQALQDFVGPLVELLDLLVKVMQAREARPREVIDYAAGDSYFPLSDSAGDLESLVPASYTVFAYLADSLVGLSHPSQEPLATEAALNAKRSLYDFIFSPGLQEYPPGTRKVVHTAAEDTLSMPYLRLLLHFDTEATLDCLDMAMEDSYLDEDAATFGTPDRQAIVQALLAILNDHTSDSRLSEGDRTFIGIFIARNLPKYSQFVKLQADTMYQILHQLATDRDLSTHQDRELAVEYLLSAFTPAYDSDLLQVLEQAEFFHVLASIYRSRKAWPQLASVYLRDAEQGSQVFQSLAQLFRDAKQGDESQLALVKAEILANTTQLVDAGISDFTNLVELYMPEEHDAAVHALRDTPLRQMAYLRCLLEPHLDEGSPTQSLKNTSRHATDDNRYTYVGLLSQYDPPSVMRYLQAEPKLDETEIVHICRERGNHEAVIWIQASHGDIGLSLDTARSVMQNQSELAIGGLLSQTGSQTVPRSLEQVIDVARAAMNVAGKVCRGELSNGGVSVEDLWYNVLSCLIETVHDVSRNAGTISIPIADTNVDDFLVKVRQLVPEAISILISSTSSETLALPHLVRRLMDNSAGSTYAEYKDILDSMLDTYRFEGDLLSTSKRLIESDLHEHVQELVRTRGTGWRPNTSGVCEACGRSVWARVNEKDRLSNPRLVVRSASEVEVSEKLRIRPKVRRRPSLKGKETDWYEEELPKRNSAGPGSQSLVVFRGGAICHAACLEQEGRPR